MAPEPDYTMSTDVIIKGTLRKAKTWNKRFFVLREGPPPKLEYYDNEKKWKGQKTEKPKRQIDLDNPWNVSKKKDSKHDYLIVIFTEDEYFTMAADNADTQNQWVAALQKALRPEPGSLLFKHVWHATLDNKELEMTSSNLLMSLHGPHRICLTHDCMVFVHATNSGGRDRSRVEPVEIRITTIRVCGHSDNSFFIEPGRASGIVSGKLWMDLGDDVMAAQMHQTILNVMYALKKEEENNSYRGRSYSSGSNSGRPRPVRSHHNNPPPSQIGMGKLGMYPGRSSRTRCDSLPGSHGVSYDSRLRTGSEGEGTLKRPLGFSRKSPNSPAMRNRLLASQGKRSQHAVYHAHTSSLPGSCHSSSEASSSEQLNSALTSSNEFSPGYSSCTASSFAPSDCLEEYVGEGRHSPTQSSIKGGLRHAKSFHGRSITPDFPLPAGSTPPIHEDTPAGRHYCPNCLIHLGQTNYNDGYFCNPRHVAPTEQAPPPPAEQPPSNPLTPSTVTQVDYVNVPPHSRTHSLDDSLSYGTAASSLSASPQQQGSFNQGAEQSTVVSKAMETFSQSPSAYSSHSENSSYSCTPSSTTSPKGIVLSSVAGDGFSSPDDYALMDFDSSNKYPHQITRTPSRKQATPPSSTFISKLISFTSGSSQNSNVATSPPVPYSSSEYTPMSKSPFPAGQATSEVTGSNKQIALATNGYVPMRAFRSKPQDIEKRRCSVPDAVPRSNSMLNGNFGVYGHSPEKCGISSAPCHCGSTYEEPPFAAGSRTGSGDSSDSPYCKMQPSSPHYNCHLKLSGDCSGSDVPDSGTPQTAASTVCSTHLATPADTVSRVSTPSPSNPSDYLSMRPLSHELRDVSNGTAKHGKTKMDSAAASPPENESNGYLMMSPRGANGVNGRRTNVAGSNENEPSRVTAHPQYPHQKKDVLSKHTFSSNSLDRPKHTKSKRPKTLYGLGRTANHTSNARRTQSFKHSHKKSSHNSHSNHVSSSPPTTCAESRTKPSPNGEYVNIDFAKAQQQTNSPFVVTVTASKDAQSTPRITLKQNSSAVDLGNEYTAMNFDPISN
uniref:Insulin receptor substrate 1 n=1 Tax=Phallusia mammillata TaxID=59560 RepID=A0A6F9DFZ8_9ASCI|nr:insulin receptor substrate 1-like [Phallusia mammillata]